MKKFVSARALMAFSSFVFGTLALFTRNIAVSSSELALYRAILAAALLSAYLLLSKQTVNFACCSRPTAIPPSPSPHSATISRRSS